MKFKFILWGLMIILGSGISLQAQELPNPNSPNFGLGVGLGTQIINGQTWQTFSFVPDLAVGPFGVGLDLLVNFQLNQPGNPEIGFYLRPEDWYLPNGTIQENLDLYLSRIVYIRYGKKGEPIYAKLGMIEDGTLGSGFILGNYSNAVLRPEKKYIGFALDIDGALVGAPFFGIETFLGNVTALDVMGGRAYIRPLSPFGVPFIGGLQLGGTYVTDLNPYYQQKDATDLPSEIKPIAVYGADVMLPVPIFPSEILGISLYSDIAFLQNGSKGLMTGLGGKILSLITWSAQARFLDANFLPTYFDQTYDLNRTQKYQVIYGTPNIPAFNGWFVSAGTRLLDDKIVFRASLEGPLGSIDNITSGLAFPKLRSFFALEEGLLPVSLTAFYNKDNIQSFESLFSAADALIGAKVSYKTGPAILSLVYNVRYIPENDPSYNINKPWEITSKMEIAIDLF